jgi:UDP-glucose 4-epimerase
MIDTVKEGLPALVERSGPARLECQRLVISEASGGQRVARAVVLGGAGFMGQYVIEALLRRGSEVLVVGGRRDEPSTTDVQVVPGELDDLPIADIVGEGAWDSVFHLAGPADVPRSVEAPVEDLSATTVTTVRMLDALRRLAKPPAFLYVSSAAVYGDAQELPIMEDHGLRPVSPYGASRLATEHYVRQCSGLFGMRTLSVRPFSVYGPGQRKQVVFDLLRRSFASGDRLHVNGPADVSRDFVYVGDVAEALVALMSRAGGRGEAYNLASGRETTLRELAETIVEVTGSGKRLEFEKALRIGDPRRWVGDTGRAAALGVKLTTSLRDGLGKTAKWLKVEHIDPGDAPPGEAEG